MATFTKDTTARDPFGKNAYLRSTQDVKTNSYTFAVEGMPFVTVDGDPTRILQPGTVIATITSGPDTGLVGAFQGGGTAEVQTLTEGTAISAGDFDIVILGETVAAIAWDVTAVTLQAAIRAAVALSPIQAYAELADSITVTGGPIASTPFTITYAGAGAGDVPQVASDDTNLTGTIVDATGTPGVAGATDGRDDTANIVGVVDTFVPWMLNERNTDIAVVYEATCVQSWCIEYNAAGVPIPLGNTTRDAIIALATLDLNFQ